MLLLQHWTTIYPLSFTPTVSTAALPQAATAAAGPASDVFGLFEQAYDPESYGLSANISGFDDYDISSFACLSIFTALESFEFISTNLTFEVCAVGVKYMAVGIVICCTE